MKKNKTEEKNKIDDILSTVILFPGSKKEYVDFIENDVEIIDLNRFDKGILYDRECGKIREDYNIKKYLIEEGIEAIINITLGYSHRMACLYGLPVKRKK